MQMVGPNNKWGSNGKTLMLVKFTRMKRLSFPPILWKTFWILMAWTTQRVFTFQRWLSHRAKMLLRKQARLSSLRKLALIRSNHRIKMTLSLCKWWSRLRLRKSRSPLCKSTSLLKTKILRSLKFLKTLEETEPHHLWCSNRCNKT